MAINCSENNLLLLNNSSNNISNLGNNETESEVNLLRHSLEWTVIFSILYGLIFVTGFVGNIMVIIVISKNKKLRNVTVTNKFILNLAVADLLVILFCVPATLAATIFTPWLLGSFMCKAMPYVQGASVAASACSLVAIALDRCQGMYRPMQRGQGLSKFQANIFITVIWLFALFMSFPWLAVFQVVPFDNQDKGPFCMEVWPDQTLGRLYFIIVNLISYFLLPLLIISIANLLVWYKVSHRQLPQNVASITTITNLHKKTRQEVRKMLTIVTLTFPVCFLPIYIIVSRFKLFPDFPVESKEMSVYNILIPISQLLVSVNSSINPIIYAFVNSKFRKMFKTILHSSFGYCRNEQSSSRNETVRYQQENAGHVVVVCVGNHEMANGGVSSRSSSVCSRGRASRRSSRGIGKAENKGTGRVAGGIVRRNSSIGKRTSSMVLCRSRLVSDSVNGIPMGRGTV